MPTVLLPLHMHLRYSQNQQKPRTTKINPKSTQDAGQGLDALTVDPGLDFSSSSRRALMAEDGIRLDLQLEQSEGEPVRAER
jgi:hypothetical protein